MRRRSLLAGSSATAVSAVFRSRASAQVNGRLRRIGYFGVTPTDYLFRSFHVGLKELGYVEGRDVELIYVRHVQGDPGTLNELAARLAAANPDVIVSGTTAPTLALCEITQTIPIVMVTVSDAIGSGLIETSHAPDATSQASRPICRSSSLSNWRSSRGSPRG